MRPLLVISVVAFDLGYASACSAVKGSIQDHSKSNVTNPAPVIPATADPNPVNPMTTTADATTATTKSPATPNPATTTPTGQAIPTAGLTDGHRFDGTWRTPCFSHATSCTDQTTHATLTLKISGNSVDHHPIIYADAACTILATDQMSPTGPVTLQYGSDSTEIPGGTNVSYIPQPLWSLGMTECFQPAAQLAKFTLLDWLLYSYQGVWLRKDNKIWMSTSPYNLSPPTDATTSEPSQVIDPRAFLTLQP